MDSNNIYQLSVQEIDVNSRLDKFLSSHIADISRSTLQKLIKEGQVARDQNKVVDPAYKVKLHENYQVMFKRQETSTMVATPIPIKIVYEDDDLLVIDKQAGLTVHPGAGNHNDTLANALLSHFGENLSSVGGVLRPGIVHRLDKDTSGLILAAKNDKAHYLLAEQLKLHAIKRTYLALCWGVPRPASGSIATNIGRDKINRKKMAVVVGKSGKHAKTNYNVLKVFASGAVSLVECNLETGRTHQIRVHMAHKGNNILGDQVYTGRRAGSVKQLTENAQQYIKNFKRQALHSHRLVFVHPVTHKEIELTSELPEDMAELVSILSGE